ncbi:arginyl-tRNA synthase [Alkalihalobacillus alcalophilus ATCC 27647 = CGMCC 1.3604]|uniref:Arginine--tRNA ligase n=1 Tax=Alkalihalobacillus alcalophilus ATCC 27647 = CGMCC 1.3604 TaxID=1218173 RepID=A0A094WGP0_ALKAL|nr:arginine--tRNA ligase [Alkalihalobacillus alcalophilus]KGA96924.1 arginine--tRNA ligase [Alkalihalobacillus alcalophilus ATCC 27647 = CGMCC 1.3604]MED1562277.1 arginine--tRNA ligase [Alkalihalobacillus alcalophilus]THG88819.1 arginyl-tRNA synthase [Alkalihalobacillus alcalophilus ATCC 27647 = CGMCC 1.3604]
MEAKQLYAEEIEKTISGVKKKEEIEGLIEKPKFEEQGDLAFPCFVLAKQLKQAPAKIAEQLANQIQASIFSKVVAVGPYVNVFLNRAEMSKSILSKVLAEKECFGAQSIGEGQVLTIDYSSPNIAKPFSMGHLRSTVIGNSLATVAKKNGYQVVRINHLGDWGTQFGKLITAYKKWGNPDTIKENPIKELLALYVKFHEEAEEKRELEDEARAWFKRLEDGNVEATELWNWFKDESLQEFAKIYQLLGVPFDSYHGEAFYNDKMDGVIKELENKNVLERSDGADVVSLEKENLPPCLIRKSDGATLYATRDLAAAIYRQKTYQFSKSFYVVGHEQSLHFQQIKLVLEKLGYDWAKEIEHIPFGFILQNGRKMSTRKGRVILLEEVIKEAIDLAKQNINEKNPNLVDKDEVAKQVGVGAIIFHDLKNEKQNNVEFSLEDMLRFEGTTGPYVQYTHARACSILRKAKFGEVSSPEDGLDDSYSWAVLKLVDHFPHVVERSFLLRDPSKVAKYVLELAQEFNKYYSHVKILVEDEQYEARLALVKAVTIVLKEGLRLLGVKAPKQM